MPEKKVAVIDGNSLMHRAFHAVPFTMNAPDGTPTNAVFGFIAMLLKFIDISQPDAIVCAFDAGRPAFRMEALEQYKAQRPPMDESLKVQFPIIEELLESMNIPVVRVKGWEGDDILGTVSARDEALGYRTLLVSGDKDVYQLCTELTHVVTTRKGITDVAIYGPSEVRDRYGVGPEQFPDFLGLKGDSSDNIPGVPGVGDKTAAKLLTAYGNLEGIYEHIDELKGKQKERMVENREAAFTSRKVATIVRDLDFELDLEGASFPSFSPEAVTKTFSKYRFNAHLARVLKLVGEEPQRKAAAIEVGEVVRGAEAEALVDAAMLYRGTHYRWGGKSPMGIDCSGLVSMAYMLCGILIYRDAHIMEGFPIHEISLEHVKPGDLLFFPGHVAMYLGHGRYCHSTGRSGDNGFALNSLNPGDPDYRSDLKAAITQVGSYF